MTSGMIVVEPVAGEKNTSVVHSMPCKIHYDGRAAVSLYFQPTPATDEKQLNDDASTRSEEYKGGPISMTAQFRGRQLKGKRYSLETMSGMKGVVLKKGSNTIEIDSNFDDILIWGHGIEPSCSNSLQRAADWGRVSSALHSAIPLE